MTDETEYTDDDFVYVDPKKKAVLGKVIWITEGKAKPMEMEFIPRQDLAEEKTDDKKPKHRPRKPRKQFYPWCSFKTAKKVYHVEGKYKGGDEYDEFNVVLGKALVEPYWD